MSKITLSQIADLTQSTTAQTTINSNSTTVQTAFDNTLSRDGTSPNQMGSNLDMNSNQILNLPSPATVNSPARLIDVVTNPTILVPPVGTSGAVVPLLNTANTWSSAQTFQGPNVSSGSSTFNGNITVNGGANVFGGLTTFLNGTLFLAGATSGSTVVAPFNTVASGTVLVPNGPATLLSTAGHISTGTASNPTGTSSTASQVMMGLGSTFTFTPLYSTRALIIVTGQLLNTTINDGAIAQIRFGTGTAPVNGAAFTGTTAGQIQAIQTVTANTTYPTTLIGLALSLTPGTAYWIDVSLAAITGGLAQIVNCGFTAVEI